MQPSRRVQMKEEQEREKIKNKSKQDSKEQVAASDIKEHSSLEGRKSKDATVSSQPLPVGNTGSS